MMTDSWKQSNCRLCADGIPFVLDDRPGIVPDLHQPLGTGVDELARPCTATERKYTRELETRVKVLEMKLSRTEKAA